MSVTRSRLLTSICLLAVGLQSVLAEPQFPVLQTTATGAAPHGIRFARGKILVAAAGDDRIEIFDLANLEKLAQWPVANAPLDLIALGDDWLVAPFAADGTLKEARVQRFPEYVDVMFPLSRKLPFEIIGAAAWNEPMANYRRSALKKIEADPQRASEWTQYLGANQIMEKALDGRDDDPVFIHSDAYDTIIKQGLEPYDRLFNDELGPGGWRNINAAHYRLLARALDEHRGEGKRFLITFGPAQSMTAYWQLSARLL